MILLPVALPTTDSVTGSKIIAVGSLKHVRPARREPDGAERGGTPRQART